MSAGAVIAALCARCGGYTDPPDAAARMPCVCTPTTAPLNATPYARADARRMQSPPPATRCVCGYFNGGAFTVCPACKKPMHPRDL